MSALSDRIDDYRQLVDALETLASSEKPLQERRELFSQAAAWMIDFHESELAHVRKAVLVLAAASN